MNVIKCNHGDLIIVKNRNFLYKLIREWFYNKPKIKVRTTWVASNIQYKTYYQEDCTLLFEYELTSMQLLNNEVPYNIKFGEKTLRGYNSLFKKVKIGLYNIQLVFKNNIVITIPITPIQNAIKSNEFNLKKIDNKRIIEESLKNRKYKGEYFRNQVKERNIESWTSNYCGLCGKPVYFKFYEDEIHIENTCNCR